MKKLIYAIIGKEDTEVVTSALSKSGFQATKLSTTGGFLKRGNTTLMICVDEKKMQDVIAIIKKVCGKRQSIDINVPYVDSTGDIPMTLAGVTQKVEIGGAIIFAVNVDYFEKI